MKLRNDEVQVLKENLKERKEKLAKLISNLNQRCDQLLGHTPINLTYMLRAARTEEEAYRKLEPTPENTEKLNLSNLKRRRLEIKEWGTAALFQLKDLKLAMAVEGDGRICQYSKTDAYALGKAMRIGEMINMVTLPRPLPEDSQSLLREMLGELSRQKDDLKIEIVDGEEIIKTYREVSFGSCMHHEGYEGSRHLKVYADSEHVKMITAREENGRLLARALLWQVYDPKTQSSEIMLDRVYPPGDNPATRALIEYAPQLGVRRFSERLKNSTGLISILKAERGIPYLDTMCIRRDRDQESGKTIMTNSLFNENLLFEKQLTRAVRVQSTSANILPDLGGNTEIIKELEEKLSEAPTWESITDNWKNHQEVINRQRQENAAEVRLIEKLAKKRSKQQKQSINVRAVKEQE